MNEKIKQIILKEFKRQQNTINLIASENYVSPAVLKTISNPFINKYAEGYPGARYYAGTVNCDDLESSAQQEALDAFGLNNDEWRVNLQGYSGSVANLAVYGALLEPGDTFLAMNLSHGGHLTHGHKVSFTGKAYKAVHYGVNKESGLIDFDEVEKLAQEHKPKLIVCGGSAYSREIDFARFVEIAKKVDAYVLADIAHIAGLIAAGEHRSPFDDGVDVVTTTTHKTLRGPRGSLIFARQEIADSVDKAVFPGLQGGPHMHTIAGIYQALSEVNTSEFKVYAQKIKQNAQSLAEALKARGYEIISGGTDNHLMLIDLSVKEITGGEAQEALEKGGVVINKNAVPFDVRKPYDPSGIRLGTPAVTTRGMGVAEMEEIAQLIDDILMKRIDENAAQSETLRLCQLFPIPDYNLN